MQLSFKAAEKFDLEEFGIQIDLQVTPRLPCVNLFIGFDLSHAPPQAVLVILVDTVGEGDLQEPVHVMHYHSLVPAALIRAESTVAIQR